MGWCTGGYVLSESWDLIKNDIPDEKKVFVAVNLIRVFEKYDMDCYEWDDPWLKQALVIVHPSWYEDE